MTNTNTLQDQSLSALNESLVSFRRHEEELLRTDITQDDLVLSVNSSSILRKSAELGSASASKEFPKCDGGLAIEGLIQNLKAVPGFSGALDAAETGEQFNGDCFQGKPSLQDLFNLRMKKFIEASKQRQEKIQSLTAVTPKEVIQFEQDGRLAPTYFAPDYSFMINFCNCLKKIDEKNVFNLVFKNYPRLPSPLLFSFLALSIYQDSEGTYKALDVF